MIYQSFNILLRGKARLCDRDRDSRAGKKSCTDFFVNCLLALLYFFLHFEFSLLTH